ncbi:MAG TPA: tetratricopeptide repeat protein [Bacillota bacterium]|nr:tetratricopeptide repeat protein [Bacillota bacterium]
MKRMKPWLIIFIILALIVASVPAYADSGSEDSSQTIITIGGIAVVAWVVSIVVTNSKAGRAYREGERYAAAGNWDLAVKAYETAAKIKKNYQDVQAKLKLAKEQAAAMFTKFGDQARLQEQYEEAIACYQSALGYLPDSTEIKAKLDSLAIDMVSIYYRRGRTFETQNRWKEALAEYEKAYKINPAYEDLSERYNTARAAAAGNLPIRALLYLVNRSTVAGLENSLLTALQTELETTGRGRFAMIDREKVRAVINEQAPGLSDSFNDNLAMDLGRILGASEVLVGEIKSVSGSGKIKVELSMRILKVPGKDVVKEISNFEYTFGNKVTLADLPQAMPELAQELAKRLVK